MELSERAKLLLTEISGWMTAAPVETARLRLRPFEETDFPDYFEYAVQKELQRLSGNPEVRTEAEAREVFDRYLPEKCGHPPTHFAIIFQSSGKVIGCFSIGFYPFLATDNTLQNKRGVSLSFVLNEDYQRRGLMTELLKRAFDFLLFEHDLDFVNCGYFEFNEGSRRLQEKVGMRPYMEHVYPEGSIRTLERILCREDYLEMRQNNDEQRF